MFKLEEDTRELIHLAIPVALSQLAVMTMQIVDVYFVGKLGTQSLAGMSVGNAVFSVFFTVGLGILLGLDFHIAHSFGAGDEDRAHEFLIQGLQLAFAVSIGFLGIIYLIGSPDSAVFRIFGIPPKVSETGSVYLRILAWSLMPMLLYQVLRQYLQAKQIAVPSLVIILLANLVNVFANYTLVFGHFGFPMLGVKGSGLATLVSRIFALLAFLGYLAFFHRTASWDRARKRVDPEKILSLLKLGIPASLQILLEVGVFSSATLLMGRIGVVALATHQIILQIASTTFMIPLGISSAAAVIVARRLGEGQNRRATAVGWRAIRFGGAFNLIVGLCLFLFALPILHLFSEDPAVLFLGKSLLLIAALFQVSDAVQVVGSGVLRGLGDTRVSMTANLIGHWVIGLPLGYYLCFSQNRGAIGIWTGLSVGLTVVALFLVGFLIRLARHLINQKPNSDHDLNIGHVENSSS